MPELTFEDEVGGIIGIVMRKDELQLVYAALAVRWKRKTRPMSATAEKRRKIENTNVQGRALRPLHVNGPHANLLVARHHANALDWIFANLL